MKKILILFAHPRFEKSRTNKILLKNIPNHPNIEIRDLYELYPDFNINIELEKRFLLSSDVIVWQHPFYWYSSPPLLKQWIDMVLEFGWAYGPGGNNLKDKYIFNSITSGGPREVYHREGRNRFTVSEFLAPFNQTAFLCNMIYLPPFAIQGTHKLSDSEIIIQSNLYRQFLMAIVEDKIKMEKLTGYEFINDFLIENKGALK